MDKGSEKTNHFGFTQFRFVVAGILLLAAGLKAYQLATAPLARGARQCFYAPA